MKQGVIPKPAWVVAGILAAVGVFFFAIALVSHRDEEAFAILGVVSWLLAGFSLLVGYVNGDARRRGMRHVMWTWLAILVPNGIGIILYFILRDPLQNYCTGCGMAVGRGYGFCPRCGVRLAAACAKCNRVCLEGWTHCAYCGTRL